MLAACNGSAMIGQQQQQQQQQQLQTMQDQQQQQFGYNAAYTGSQMYDGWPGMALKQIMGQIDLLNFQHSNHDHHHFDDPRC